MKSTSLLKIVNPILALLFISQALSGLFHKQLSHDAFEVVHEGGGIALIVCVIIHVGLNWRWIAFNLLMVKTRR